jgi:SAM-dependent methyltransferase
MIPEEFMKTYNRNLMKLRSNPGGFNISEELRYDVGTHPDNFIDYECTFAAHHINRLSPKTILDIGSYRHFILGLLAHFKVITIDIRDRKTISNNEIMVTCDAKHLDLADNSFDLVVSLCTIEHLGLGRYGDEFDVDADKKAFQEMIRVLKPGGHLIFTTTITRAQPCIAYNAHRIYSYEMLRAFCDNLICIEEKFYSHRIQGFCSWEEVSTEPNAWDVYCGCWQKKKARRLKDGPPTNADVFKE